MNREELRTLLRRHRRGSLSAADLEAHLRPYLAESIAYATVDHGRESRQGFPEVILCEGKTPQQVAGIARQIVAHGSVLLATRASRKHYISVRRAVRNARYDAVARTISANTGRIAERGKGTVLVVTAGTSDIPVAAEALETARIMGNRVDHLYDVGVAGIHRILGQTKKLRMASVIIVVAGMEGALASVVGGLVNVPVIAVPTSVGYGASFKGVSALLGMLNSCAAGVTVVNIDNGFGAGFAASLINQSR
jgi:pyridinium-3,5-biscarboxylic acid mononucleotide synthase